MLPPVINLSPYGRVLCLTVIYFSSLNGLRAKRKTYHFKNLKNLKNCVWYSSSSPLHYSTVMITLQYHLVLLPTLLARAFYIFYLTSQRATDLLHAAFIQLRIIFIDIKIFLWSNILCIFLSPYCLCFLLFLKALLDAYLSLL